MKKIIITGGPHTGKTTLLNALQEELKSEKITFVKEPAVALISEELRKEKENPNYKGIYPWNSYPEFRTLVIKKSKELEDEIDQNSKVAILDRSLIDNIAYTRMNNLDHLLDDLVDPINEANYHTAVICDFVGTYTKTEERQESFEEAQNIHQELLKAYKEQDLNLVYLPEISVEERVIEFVNLVNQLSS